LAALKAVPTLDQTDSPHAALTTEKKKIIETHTDNCILLYCTVPLFQVFKLNKAYGTQARKTLEITIVFRLPTCWPVVSTHPDCPTRGHINTFVSLPLSLSKY
jgi:hypothetical protein